jgi:hypothetical protein
MPNPDDFEYLADMSEQELWEKVRYADRHGLDELAKACRGRLGIRDKSNDFLFVSFGNIGQPEESVEPEDEQAEDGEAPRCDAEITPIDGDTSYAATHCGRVEGHAPEKRSGRIEHQSYAALARKRKGSTLADKVNDFDFRVIGG